MTREPLRSNGVMEWWSNARNPSTPILQYSTTPNLLLPIAWLIPSL
jgi:hypothetical protein